MPFKLNTFSPGVFLPEELAMLQRVYNRLESEAWWPDDEAERKAVADRLMRYLDHGMVDEQKLFTLCCMHGKKGKRRPRERV